MWHVPPRLLQPIPPNQSDQPNSRTPYAQRPHSSSMWTSNQHPLQIVKWRISSRPCGQTFTRQMPLKVPSNGDAIRLLPILPVPDIPSMIPTRPFCSPTKPTKYVQSLHILEEKLHDHVTDGWVPLPADPSNSKEKAASSLLKSCLPKADS